MEGKPEKKQPKGSSLKPFFPRHEDLQWLRDYKNHQDNVLYQRINFFALMLSIFIASVLSIEGNPVAQILFSILGLSLTYLWWRSVDRQHKIVEYIRDELYKMYVPYQKLRYYRDPKLSNIEQTASGQELSNKKPTVSGQKLLVHCVPLLFGVFWDVILVIAVLDLTKIKVSDDFKMWAGVSLSVVTVIVSFFLFFLPAVKKYRMTLKKNPDSL